MFYSADDCWLLLLLLLIHLLMVRDNTNVGSDEQHTTLTEWLRGRDVGQFYSRTVAAVGVCFVEGF